MKRKRKQDILPIQHFQTDKVVYICCASLTILHSENFGKHIHTVMQIKQLDTDFIEQFNSIKRQNLRICTSDTRF